MRAARSRHSAVSIYNLHRKDILKLEATISPTMPRRSHGSTDIAGLTLRTRCCARQWDSQASRASTFLDMKDASVVPDISMPLRPDLIGQFDLAIDGGTLEHVFNFPAAAADLLRLVKVGGAVYTQNPCNNLAGHGFYQFSPELMYRMFSQQNGFEVGVLVRLAIARNQQVEQTTDQPVYEVIDPVEIWGTCTAGGANTRRS